MIRNFYRVILLLAVFTAFFATTASAQESGNENAPLQIEEPVDGAQVETPFTVSGRAPAGAQLELWVGDTLERVFRADSTGRFSAAVSDDVERDTEISIHQVGARGRRVQSTSITVSWAGDAAAREPELVGRPPTPEPLETPSAPKPDPPSPSTPPTATGDLPSAEDLGFAEGDAAPAPPAPSEVRRFESSTATGTGQTRRATADASTSTTSETRRQPSPPPRGVRALAEAGAGAAGGLTGIFAGGLVGAGLGGATGEPYAALAGALLGGFVGWAAGIALGVQLTGNALEGNGSIWAVILGEVLGGIAAVAVGSAAGSSATVGGDALAVFGAIAFPITGAVLGYELTSDHSRYGDPAEVGVKSLRPVIAPSTEGNGATVGIGFRF